MDRLLRYALLALALLLMVPALLMLADAWTWIVFDRTLTGLEWWRSGRPLVAWLMAAIATFVVMAAADF